MDFLTQTRSETKENLIGATGQGFQYWNFFYQRGGGGKEGGGKAGKAENRPILAEIFNKNWIKRTEIFEPGLDSYAPRRSTKISDFRPKFKTLVLVAQRSLFIRAILHLQAVVWFHHCTYVYMRSLSQPPNTHFQCTEAQQKSLLSGYFLLIIAQNFYSIVLH